MSKMIPLTLGKFAIVDDEDYEKVNRWKWSAKKIGHTYYAVRGFRKEGKQIQIYMHRFIMGAASNQEVDHRNRFGLRNEKGNLRICTRSQNNQNRKKIITNNYGGTSKYKGVDWDKRRSKWRAQIRHNYKTFFLGRFDDEIEAARKYDEKALDIFGEFARLNNV